MHTNARVTAMTVKGVQLAGGETIPAEPVVWAAGVKAPEFLNTLDGLEINRINRLATHATLQTRPHENVLPSVTVSPRAPVAHQQALHLAKKPRRRLRDQPPLHGPYRHFGSPVLLGQCSRTGNLRGSLVGGHMWIKGLFARRMYQLLYKLHELSPHGT